jgi:hypothetical protein
VNRCLLNHMQITYNCRLSSQCQSMQSAVYIGRHGNVRRQSAGGA